MRHIISFFFCCCCLTAWSCTSVIISGDRTASGRPVMFKHRDTKSLNNEVSYFDSEQYRFIGITNSPSKAPSVWAGTNETGFCIMNTASYNLQDDSIPQDLMGLEGRLMYEALAQCATVDEFEAFLANHTKPLFVETNIGVIDAQGGAAYFEVNNYHWTRFNISDIPEGYMVVTNFSRTGREGEGKGYDRFATASDVMTAFDSAFADSLWPIDHHQLMSNLSRNFEPSAGLIPRRITASVVTFEGVQPGEDPLHTIMWTCLGYPVTDVTLPLLVGTQNLLPKQVQHRDRTCDFTRTANRLKKQYVYPSDSVFVKDRLSSLTRTMETVEQQIDSLFVPVYTDWIQGHISSSDFERQYLIIKEKFYPLYCKDL